MMTKGKIVFASDHAGYSLKNKLMLLLRNEGYDVSDVGAFSEESCDYPVFAELACDAVLHQKAERAILICGTGVGMSMAANKINGVRAACCSDVFSTKYTRLHNDANVLCLGARVLGEGLAFELVKIFVETEYEGGKHARRVAMLSELEEKQKKA